MADERMTTFLSPLPAATFLAFHPQDNNLITIGLEDLSIQIYNIQVHKVKTKLKGHQKRITGLAFLNILNVLHQELTFGLRVYPLVIAAHPSNRSQFAFGMKDGGVLVLEPLESEGEWCMAPPVENGGDPSTTSGATGSEQTRR